jgi:hypothetical protein
MALDLATVTLVWAEAEVIWVEAAAPVTARARTKKRTMIFIGRYLESCIYFLRFLWTDQMK